MLNFLSSFNNTNLLGFPNTKGVNSSGGAATDGTEFVANFINDLWGMMQGLLERTGQTPNGIVEAFDNSQIIKALQRFTIPGMIVPVAWNDDPLVLGIRALFLSGQGILRANYEDLDDIVYVGDADNPTASSYYHADDVGGTSRNIAGIYLILPDLRGRVVSGLDLTGSVDPDGASRDLGSNQDDAMQRIVGQLGNQLSGGGWADAVSCNGVFDVTDPADRFETTLAGGYFSTVTFDNDHSLLPNPAKTDDIESRMINTAFNYMITY